MPFDLTTLKLIAAASLVGAMSAQAQLPVNGYTPKQDQLLLGFTIPPSTGDLFIDLGTATQVGVGGASAVDLIAHQNVGQTKEALLEQLNSLYGNMNSLQWGIVGGHYINSVNSAIYCTVPHGALPPVVGSPAALESAINTVGYALADFPGVTPNQAIVDPTAGFGESWTEQIAYPTSQWQKNAASPDSTTPSSFATGGVKYQMADLYVRTNSTSYAPVYSGFFTLGNDGSLTFTPGTNTPPVVPPPAPVLSISRAGNTSTISFLSTNNATYSLYYTNTSGLTRPTTNWAISGTTITGNGTTEAFTDTTPDADRVYRVIAR